MKKEFVEEDVFYSPSSVPLDEGLEDIKEVDERETIMAEEDDTVMEEESDVPEVTKKEINWWNVVFLLELTSGNLFT